MSHRDVGSCTDPPAGGAFRTAAWLAGTFAITLGVLVLAGWTVGSALLKSIAPGLPSMKANTALALISAGAAVLCLRTASSARTRRIGRVLAVLVAGLGVVVIAEYLFGGLGIDQLLFRDPGVLYPGRPSPQTAVAFVALGLALSTIEFEGRWRWGHFVMLALTATVVLFAAVGYLYGVEHLRGTSGTSGMAVHTLVALVLLTVAVPCLNPNAGLAAWVRSDDAGARMARMLIPVAVGGPLVLGGLRFETEQLGWDGWRIGLAAYTLSMVLVLVIVVAVVARRLRGADLELRGLAAIVDASDDAMINKTTEGVIVSWNGAARRLYGYEANEAVGRSISILAPRDHSDEIPRLLDGVKRGEVQRVETERVRRDGTLLSVALTISPIRDPTGQVVGASTTARDITETRRLKEQLTAARDLFAGVLDAATETSIIATDQHGLITVFNRGAERLLGRRASDLIGVHPLTVCHDATEIAARAAELGVEPGFKVLTHGTLGGGAETREWTYLHSDGHRLTVSLTMTAVHGEPTEIRGFIGVARDVTEVRLAEAARRLAEQRFETAFEHAPIGVAITGIRGPDRGCFLHANHSLARLVGREPGALDGTPISALTHPDDLAGTRDALVRLEAMEAVELEKRYRHRDGRWISVLESSTPILDETGEQALYCVSQVLDISERQRFETQLRHLADHDALTSLHNRRRFESELDRVIDESRRYARRFALLVVDLDGFKTINDRFGHAAGDELLTRIGRLLRESVRDTDFIARLGGDEFAVILHEAGQSEAIVVADKVLDAIRLGGEVRGGSQQARVTGSIGITTLAGDGELLGGELVAEADIAMYDAKLGGSDRYTVHDPDQRRDRPGASNSWSERLQHAIAEDLFVLHASRSLGSAPRTHLGTSCSFGCATTKETSFPRVRSSTTPNALT